MVDGSMQRALALRREDAAAVPPGNARYRRRPRFRTSAPGVGTIISFNLLFVWWLMTASA